MRTQSAIASFLLVSFAGLPHGALSFSSSRRRGAHGQLISKLSPSSPLFPSHTSSSSSTVVITHNSISTTSTHATTSNSNWTPQDLTNDNPGYLPIPTDDYIKKYQTNPKLWPVEFFIIVYRHHVKPSHQNGKTTTQILVRKSANGTSKYGVGTGVPVTRWMLSSSSPPRGYKVAVPEIMWDASVFPEFPTGEEERTSWTYSKIDICEDAFQTGSSADDDAYNFEDDQLEEYASRIRQQLQNDLSLQLLQNKKDELSAWDVNVLSTVKSIVDNDNSVAAIQGSFRMSGLFGYKDSITTNRFVNFDNAPDPTSLIKSTKIYTMFPQMPDPMPSPTSTPSQLKDEILSRPRRMQESGRDPHKDEYGRVYTHISTSNVSNTIHGVYITFDATDLLPGDDDVPPAYDLFGTMPIEREWVSLDDLKVTEEKGDDGRSVIGECDTKSEFISGFIVRQLIRDGVIVIGINEE
eukprot:scaffold8079_cov69-Skeletonema_dohrnii-CCMP3373.AAC.3